MSTIIYERGDVVLLNIPLGENLEMALRPVMVLRDCSSPDSRVSTVPITPDPMVDCNATLIPLGCFESARMGLVTNAYLNAVEEIPVQREFIVQKIGKCPYRLFDDFLKTYRRNLGYMVRAAISLTADTPAPFAPGSSLSRSSA